MKTLLRQFCTEFDGVVRPLLAPVREVMAKLGDGSENRPVFEELPRLRDAHHKLNLLTEKISRQQAYVLIFGPLKSGKSTLMNAVTAAYVSEVTSLPAYPCLVYVSHAEKPEFSITHYNGSTETLSSAGELRDRIDDAHRRLSQRIREVETETVGGEAQKFEPSVHFPEAIRKVDVKVPAGELAESGAVLVDTPGLYTRMKFGYGQMTRDFRDTAACAVFVVKTDNLFLEQVFAEFHELLELFGRIFLVVNLDGTKRDLRPDGSLAPSLERANPQSIIEAFESLAMSAPIKEAAEAGRLKIYPIDLLRAASLRLQERNGTAEEGREDGDGILEESDDTPQTGFEAFRRDMSSYLNSTEYLTAFVGDSIRYASNLASDLRQLCLGDAVQQIHIQRDQVDVLRQDSLTRVETLKRLIEREWSSDFETLEGSFETRTSAATEEWQRDSRRQVEALIDEWFESDDSLDGLTGARFHRWSERLDGQLLDRTRANVEASLAEGTTLAGLALPTELREDLHRVGIDLGQIDATAREALPKKAEGKGVTWTPVYTEIPVRKAVLDWILFRSRGTLREKILGPPSAPTKAIPQPTKEKHLGVEARQFFKESAHHTVDRGVGKRWSAIGEQVFETYRNQVQESLLARLRTLHQEASKRLAEQTRRANDLDAIANGFRTLEKTMGDGLEAIEVLDRRYANPSELDEEMLRSG